MPVDVEVFPTGAAIQPGHRLRISIQAFDVPHLFPTLPDLFGTLTRDDDPRLGGVPVGAHGPRAGLTG